MKDRGARGAAQAEASAMGASVVLRPAGQGPGEGSQEGPCRHKDKWPRATTSGHFARQRPGGQTGYNLPKHVRNCANQGGRNWWVWSWKESNPIKKTRVPYTCGSWRCDGACARADAHQLFARLKKAIDGVGVSDGWTFLVLTIDRAGHFSGEPWSDAQTAYRSLSEMSRKWLKRFRRYCGRVGWTDPGNRWAMVIEAHASGWPHANLMLFCPELASALAHEKEARELAGLTGRDSIKLGTRYTPERGYTKGPRAMLGDISTETGWGLESTADAARSNDALAGYIVKLAGHPDANVGELAKLTQTPKAAPFKFRRLRSGKGFLPPRYKNPEYTGALVKRVTDLETGYVYALVPEPKGGHRPERLEAVQMAQRIESRCIEEDEERQWYESKMREGPPAIPLVTRWIGDQMVPQQQPEPQTWEEARAVAQQELRKSVMRERKLRKAQADLERAAKTSLPLRR